MEAKFFLNGKKMFVDSVMENGNEVSLFLIDGSFILHSLDFKIGWFTGKSFKFFERKNNSFSHEDRELSIKSMEEKEGKIIYNF